MSLPVCPECGGFGYRVRYDTVRPGTHEMEDPCPACGGTGKDICPECKGLGFLPPSWQVKAQRHVAPDCPACGGSGVGEDPDTP